MREAERVGRVPLRSGMERCNVHWGGFGMLGLEVGEASLTRALNAWQSCGYDAIALSRTSYVL